MTMASISTPVSECSCQREEAEEYIQKKKNKALISTPVSKWRCPTEDAEEIYTVGEEGDDINTDEERPISRSIKFSLLFVTLNFLPFSSFESTHSGCKSCNSTARFPNPQHFSLVGGFKPSVISGKKANGKWGG